MDLDPGILLFFRHLLLHCRHKLVLFFSYFGLSIAAWWQQHGINCLELQHIAIRILSQSCTSVGCEHNWSTFDTIRSARHSRFAQKKLNDFAFVHYNLRLREHERGTRRSTDESVSLDGVFLEDLLDNWIVDVDRPASHEDEVPRELPVSLMLVSLPQLLQSCSYIGCSLS